MTTTTKITFADLAEGDTIQVVPQGGPGMSVDTEPGLQPWDAEFIGLMADGRIVITAPGDPKYGGGTRIMQPTALAIPWQTRKKYEARAAQITLDTVVEEPKIDYGDRNTAIILIREALKKRTGKAWSVTGGKGTAWGWITIQAPPKRRGEYGFMTDEDAAELGKAMGFNNPAHCQGISIAASGDHRREYIERAQGKTPTVIGQQYWD